jgi:FkbM family methyltransferase
MPFFIIESRQAYREANLDGFTQSQRLHVALSPGFRNALEESRLAYMPVFARAGLDAVVDVGANEGQWIRALLAVTKVNRIEAFEPVPEAELRLRELFAGNPQYRSTRAAVGEIAGEMELNITADSRFSSLLKPVDSLSSHYASGPVIQQIVSTRVVPLDEALKSIASIDLLKIDAQGFEDKVLSGAKETLERTKVILMEANLAAHYCGDHDIWYLNKRLSEEFKFQFWNLSPIQYGANQQAMWCDAVFVNPRLMV